MTEYNFNELKAKMLNSRFKADLERFVRVSVSYGRGEQIYLVPWNSIYIRTDSSDTEITEVKVDKIYCISGDNFDEVREVTSASELENVVIGCLPLIESVYKNGQKREKHKNST